MKEIKAFVHRGREQSYSLELGERVTNQLKLEVGRKDDQTARAVQLIREQGRTGQSVAGWVYQSTLAWLRLRATQGLPDQGSRCSVAAPRPLPRTSAQLRAGT